MPAHSVRMFRHACFLDRENRVESAFLRKSLFRTPVTGHAPASAITLTTVSSPCIYTDSERSRRPHEEAEPPERQHRAQDSLEERVRQDHHRDGERLPQGGRRSRAPMIAASTPLGEFESTDFLPISPAPADSRELPDPPYRPQEGERQVRAWSAVARATPGPLRQSASDRASSPLVHLSIIPNSLPFFSLSCSLTKKAAI